MQLDVVATWNESVLFAGRLRAPVSLSDFLPDRAGLVADVAGYVVVPAGFSRDADGSLTSGDLRVRIAPRASIAMRRAPHVGLALVAACCSVALHGTALEVSRAMPVDANVDAAERLTLIQHLLAAHAETETSEDEVAPTSIDAKAKGEEGATGSPKALAEKDAHVPVAAHGRLGGAHVISAPDDDTSRAAEREAMSFGMIGVIGHAASSVSHGPEGLDAHAGARGDVWGAGDAFGSGLGLSGIGRAGGASNQEFSGDVRAGEWDDNLTLREFRRVLTASHALPLESLDVSVRRVLVALDSAGKALASCPITVTDAQGNAITLRTTSNGRALLFPRAEHLAGELVASLRCGGNSASRELDSTADDGVVRLDGREPREARIAPIDVGFALDTTGSMSEEIAAFKATLVAVAAHVSNVRVGLVEYKDRTDPYVTRVFGMTGDLPQFSQTVAWLSASGGGDEPEAVNVGIHEAISSLAWNEDAPARLLFVIGDAPPHAYDPGPSYAGEAQRAAHAGIQIFTIAASGMDAFGQVVFRQLAQYTGGTEMFVLRGGVGPQSIGGGDPMTSCGGTQKHYASGNLDALVIAKIEAARRALDEDPLAVRGVGQDVVSSCK